MVVELPGLLIHLMLLSEKPAGYTSTDGDLADGPLDGVGHLWRMEMIMVSKNYTSKSR